MSSEGFLRPKWFETELRTVLVVLGSLHVPGVSRELLRHDSFVQRP